MILSDMSNVEARKRTADGLTDDHLDVADSALSEGNKKMKIGEHINSSLESSVQQKQQQQTESENVDPAAMDTTIAQAVTSPSRSRPQSPIKIRAPSPVRPRSPPKPEVLPTEELERMENGSRAQSPARVQMSLDTPEATPAPKPLPPSPKRSPVREVENTAENATEMKPMEDIETPEHQSMESLNVASMEISTNFSDEALIKAQFKWAGNALRSLKRCHDVGPFLVPVDPMALGIPDYFNVIKNPMDISTIEKKLQSNSYGTPQNFIDDVQLMLQNCFTYNPEGHPVHLMGRNVEKLFESNLKRMPKTEADLIDNKASSRLSAASAYSPVSNRPKREVHHTQAVYPVEESSKRKKSKSKPEDLKWCHAVWNELMKKKHEVFMFVFYKPVDPVALNIPTYFDIIKEPMDLSTMKRKLDTDEYDNAEQFEADFRLMIRNCYTFNRPGDDVYLMGQRAEEVFNHKWTEKALFLSRLATSQSQSAKSKKKKSISGIGKSVGSSLSSLREDEYSSSEEDDETTKSLQLQTMIQQQLLLLQELSKKKSKKSKNGSSKSRRSSAVSAITEMISQVVPGVSAAVQPAVSQAIPAPRPAPPPKAAAPRPQRPSQPKKKKKDEIREISFEEKKELSEAINNLSGDKLGKDSGQEEIELDIDSLDLITLNKLWNFVKGSERRRKNKGATITDQAADAARIHELELELARLEGRSDKTKLLQENAEIINNGGSAQQSPEDSGTESDSESE